jgi:hypothetical protein
MAYSNLCIQGSCYKPKRRSRIFKMALNRERSCCTEINVCACIRNLAISDPIISHTCQLTIKPRLFLKVWNQNTLAAHSMTSVYRYYDSTDAIPQRTLFNFNALNDTTFYNIISNRDYSQCYKSVAVAVRFAVVVNRISSSCSSWMVLLMSIKTKWHKYFLMRNAATFSVKVRKKM